MRQLQITRPPRSRVAAPIAIQSIPNMPETAILVKEIETTTVRKRERTYLIPRPVCTHCGEVKERVIGAYFECFNEECPGHDPDPAAAIPLPAEGEKLIDVEPIRRAA